MEALEENIEALAQRLDAPLIGWLPFDPGMSPDEAAPLLAIDKLAGVTV